jgi:hypothetical protein
MATKYREAIAEMRQAMELLGNASEKLLATFGTADRTMHSFGLYMEGRRCQFTMKPDEIELQWRQTAWRILVDRLELKRICSVKRAEEIDKQLNDPKALPEITEANMVAMIEGNGREIGNFLEEAAVEVFEAFRPWREYGWNKRFKTNELDEIGEKVCLDGYVERGYNKQTFRLSYYSERTQRIRCLDNIMHMLDGKGPVPTHAGPLVDALNSTSNTGRVETEYFVAKCYMKGSLHLKFKRLDLLAKLNAIGGAGLAQLKKGK